MTTQTTPQKSSIKQQLRTDLGRSVGVTTATQLVWLTGLRAHLPTPRNSRVKDTHLKRHIDVYCIVYVIRNDISIIYVTVQMCRRTEEGSQRHRHFVGFFKRTRLSTDTGPPFLYGYSEKPPHLVAFCGGTGDMCRRTEEELGLTVPSSNEIFTIPLLT